VNENEPDVDHQDEVDRLVAAWRRELPDLDVSPFEILSRITRLARHLDRARRLVFATHDLEPWEFDVLTALRRAGQPYELSPGRLLTQTLVTSGTMTNRIDRLATKGLVERRPEPADRRGVRVRLTDNGQQRVDAALAELLEHERALLAGLAEDDRDRLAGLLRRLVMPFDEQA
jgi:DNA-binding MarR family transcriptional regulator